MEVIIPSAFFLNKMPPIYVSNHQLSILCYSTKLCAEYIF